MKSKDKYVLATILIGLILTSGFLAFSAYRGLNEDGMKACVWSLEVPVRDSFRNKDPEIDISVSTEWKTLSKEKSKVLLSGLVKAGRTDCGRINNMQEGKDYWGNVVKIALRKSSIDEEIKVKVWSNGADSEESTEDDLRVESH